MCFQPTKGRSTRAKREQNARNMRATREKHASYTRETCEKHASISGRRLHSTGTFLPFSYGMRWDEMGWHPVSQTSLTPTCKLTVPTYRVYCSDWPWIARPGIQISGKNQLIFTLYRVGDNKYHVGGSVVLKERPKGYLTVKVYIDNRKLFKKV